MPILTVGDKFPDFDLIAVKPGDLVMVDAYKQEDYFTRVSSQDRRPGIWTVVFFWPKNFSFVCPTEITAFSEHYQEFRVHNCQVIGVTTDNEYSTFAWRRMHPDLRAVPFPLASDLTHDFVRECGVLNSGGVCDRATFILDPDWNIQHVSVAASNVGRSVMEIIRQVEALQTGAMCFADWRAGQYHINPLEELREIAV
ncbi:MAG: peroxiredoxin [Varibaculum sp.]|nr:peroxiredoxin [Varibaculum sp.]